MIRFVVPCLLAVGLCVNAAQAPAPVDVAILSPQPGHAVFGEVVVIAQVVGEEPIGSVELEVDGKAAGRLERPPFRFVVHVGNDNVEHRFVVVARTTSGAVASAALTTPRLAISETFQFSLQQLYVTATHDGQPVLDLAAEEFVVSDDGELQRLASFARGDIPFTAALLVDGSTSMRGAKLESALRGARAFGRSMQPLDEAKLVVFSDRVRLSSPFTGFEEVLTAGLEQVEAVGGTALNDVLYLALTQLEERQGRRVVVLLSDGVDTHSVLSMRHLQPCTRRSRAIVYLIRTEAGGPDRQPEEPPAASSPWRDLEGHRHEFQQLRAVVDDSGGRLLEIDRPEGIEPAFRDIVRELREHYVLGYYATTRRGVGTWHKVRVQTTRPGVEVRTSAGYMELE